MKAVVSAMLQNIAASMPKGANGKPLPSKSEMARGIAGLEHFSQESRAEYQDLTETGLLQRFRSTGTIEVREAGTTDRKITTLSLEQLD